MLGLRLDESASRQSKAERPSVAYIELQIIRRLFFYRFDLAGKIQVTACRVELRHTPETKVPG